MSEEATRTTGRRREKNTADGAEPKVKRGGGKRAAAKGAGTDEANTGRTEATVRDLIFMVSRAATGFEAILKTKDPALSLSQWAILEMLAQDDKTVQPSHVARKLGFSRQLVRQSTKKLTKLELVASEAGEQGKKGGGLSLTDGGRTILGDIRETTEALSESLKSTKRNNNVGPASRTLKGLSAEMAALSPKGTGKGTGRGRKKAAGTAQADEPVAEATPETVAAA